MLSQLLTLRLLGLPSWEMTLEGRQVESTALAHLGIETLWIRGVGPCFCCSNPNGTCDKLTCDVMTLSGSRLTKLLFKTDASIMMTTSWGFSVEFPCTNELAAGVNVMVQSMRKTTGGRSILVRCYSMAETTALNCECCETMSRCSTITPSTRHVCMVHTEDHHIIEQLWIGLACPTGILSSPLFIE